MATNRIWVLAETFGGKTITPSLELLTKARELASTVEAFTWGADTDQVAAELGNFGATKVYTAGDIGSALPGGPVAAAMAAQISADGGPDAILVPTTYDGCDIAGRLSAKIDRPVLTNVVDLSAGDSGLVSHHGVFGGTQIVMAAFAGDAKPGIFVIRAKSFSAE